MTSYERGDKQRVDRGFTLTELLVVISIIGILAGIIFISSGAVRRDTRDKRRKADVEQVAGLLQIRAAQIKLTDPSWSSGEINGETSSDGSFLPILVTERFATQIPLDPMNGATFFYSSHFSASSLGSCPGPIFTVVTRLENPTGGNSNRCSPISGGNVYAVNGQ